MENLLKLNGSHAYCAVFTKEPPTKITVGNKERMVGLHCTMYMNPLYYILKCKLSATSGTWKQSAHDVRVPTTCKCTKVIKTNKFGQRCSLVHVCSIAVYDACFAIPYCIPIRLKSVRLTSCWHLQASYLLTSIVLFYDRPTVFLTLILYSSITQLKMYANQTNGRRTS